MRKDIMSMVKQIMANEKIEYQQFYADKRKAGVEGHQMKWHNLNVDEDHTFRLARLINYELPKGFQCEVSIMRSYKHSNSIYIRPANK